MKLVVCEGRIDATVIRELCRSSGIEGLTIECCDGRNNLERYIRDIKIRPEFSRREVESLVVIIDAETNGEASWQKIQNAVKQGFDLQLEGQGIFLGESPRLAGYVVAGPDGHGMIEDLCLQAVSDQPGYSCMVQYFDCLKEKTEKKEYHSKAKFRAWMASQPDYELYVGLAAGKGYIPWESPAFSRLQAMLKQL